MKLLFITKDPDIARYAVDCGVDRLFIDLERLGKAERQAGHDTVLSDHSVADIARVRAAVPGAELLARVNPINEATEREVAEVVAAGADLVMLPMCTNAEQVERCCHAAAGRAPVVPLIETPAAMTRLASICEVRGVGEVYIGLNDLHLALGLDFMFEPLAGGLVDHLARIARASGMPFGFGGIARIGTGQLPAELVLGEHARLGSTRVILSRAFHLRASTLSELRSRIDLRAEIAALRQAYAGKLARDAREIEADRRSLRDSVQRIARIARAGVASAAGAG